MKKLIKGFTLIELLVVIGILAILLAITLIAINPKRQFQQSNDTKRSSDVNAVLNAMNQFMADNKGTFPGTAGLINATSSIISSANGFVSLCTDLVPTYIAALPADPLLNNNGTPVTASDCTSTPAWTTGYSVRQVGVGGNRLEVSAVGEITSTIQVTR